ncbi:hypothetical protein Tco_1114189 [Tanacetum coccineum]|uniref:Uncharacterized protein n=1 Tax=Tanacetum coccineum TaxID=301880 RepID=A0ABQ5IUD7_9ASTR
MAWMVRNADIKDGDSEQTLGTGTATGTLNPDWSGFQWMDIVLAKGQQHAEFRTGFAVEGQVKEKSKWFASLRDIERKLKLDLMAMEQSFFEANKTQEEVAQGYHKMQEMTKNYKV